MDIEIEIARYQRERAKLESTGLYSASDERDACGIGLVAAIDGEPRRDVVTLAEQPAILNEGGLS